MGLYTTLLIALGLSMDAFAVSVASGSRAPRLAVPGALKVAAVFGIFQAAMPLVGWLLGVGFKDYVSLVDHWIAFGLLGGIGGKMIYAELRPGERGGPPAAEAGGALTLLVLALATSVDALAVGFSLNFVTEILRPLVVIGLTTFALCLAGVALGHRYRHLNAGKVQLVGGAVLIAVGVKILFEHLS